MHKENHWALNVLLMLLFWKLGLFALLSFEILLVFFTSYVLFTSISPDIDLAIPKLGHRKQTHNIFYIALFGFVLFLISVWTSMSYKPYENTIPYLQHIILFCLGFGGAWIGHVIGDTVPGNIEWRDFWRAVIGLGILALLIWH